MEELSVNISRSNVKTGVPSFSTRPVITCVNCSTCARECYARRMERYPNVRDAWERNTEIVKRGEWEKIAGAIKAECVNARFFRWFVAGDIPSSAFFAFMCDIAQDNRGTRFLAFTKNYNAVNGYLATGRKIPRNLVVVFSGWGDALRPENPYNLPESNVYNGDDDAPVFNSRNFNCPGNCRDCNAVGVGCWQLKKGQKIWFKKH